MIWLSGFRRKSIVPYRQLNSIKISKCREVHHWFDVQNVVEVPEKRTWLYWLNLVNDEKGDETRQVNIIRGLSAFRWQSRWRSLSCHQLVNIQVKGPLHCIRKSIKMDISHLACSQTTNILTVEVQSVSWFSAHSETRNVFHTEPL